MKYYSTNSKRDLFSAKEAIVKGLPEDNGLFFPEEIPVLPGSFFENLNKYSLKEIAEQVLSPYFSGDIPASELYDIIENTFSFDIPLHKLTDDTYSLELFHGPTLAFKDIGARFLAGCLNYLARDYDKRVTVLVATSGDTGSAVAHGFAGVDNVDVIILYPKGKVSAFQEEQMTTLGGNIKALEIDGNFDDCQKFVKKAFLDGELNKKFKLTSANSINIARFIPQSVYYFYGFAQLEDTKRTVISVPSGNYGNLTAGLIAQKMGLSIAHFIASSNANDIVPQYLSSGRYLPKPSIRTISNAMDVGDPSNFVRLGEIFKDFDTMAKNITGFSFSDSQTRENILTTYRDTGYILDPHGSVGLLGLKKYLITHEGVRGIFLETAHPVKFRDVVEEELQISVPLPGHVKMSGDKSSKTKLNNQYDSFRDFLLSE